tara:strand:+ start:7153 stop:8850 length:1698 start_codon:yes stop_codon:yes gene_type:complete
MAAVAESRNKSGQTLIQQMQDRWHRLDTIFSSWRSHGMELSRNYLPWSGRFWVEDRNEGWMRNQDQIDNTPARAIRILSAGLTAGASSPARPWFRMGVRDPELMRKHSVRTFLDDVTRIILKTFSGSNVYRALQQIYTECPLYGTSAAILVPHPERGVHMHVLPFGQFRAASGPDGNVQTLYREMEMSVAQVVREFGFEKCSDRVQELFGNNGQDEPVTVRHAVEPRMDRDVRFNDNTNMPWRSVYWEVAQQPDETSNVLRESGFMRFPAMVPRWSLIPGDDYGSGPGMDGLGDVIQLQQEQYRKSQLIDFASDPSMLLPSDMKNQESDLAPGGKNYSDASGSNQGRPLWQPGQHLQPLLEDIQDVRSRINSVWFADMFLMIAQTDKNMTATEVAERHEEKLLMLGPALERLHNELLEPLVNLTFNYLLEAGQLPDIPPELAGREIEIEFVSMLAQTQRAVGAKTIDRFMATAGAASQLKPEILDRLNGDEFVEDLADRLGVPPRFLNSREEADELREQRNEMQAAQAQTEMMGEQAGVASELAKAANLSPTPPEQQFSQVAGSQ